MNLDSDNDHPMRTPPSNSPPSSADERSPPSSPQMRSRSLPDLGPGVLMQVSEILADSEAEGNEYLGKRKREEREMILAAQAENDKLLDKEWREAWLKRWQDDFNESDMKPSTLSISATPSTQGASANGNPEKT